MNIPILLRLSIVGIFLVLPQTGLASIERLKVEGTWDGKKFNVERLKLRNPGKDASRIRVSGTVRHFSHVNRRLQIGPVNLKWSADQAEKMSSIGLGDVLQVDALSNRDDTFTVLKWERTTLDTAESIELIGTVTASRENGEVTELFLAKIPTYSPRRLYRNGRVPIRRLGDNRPDEQLSINIGKVRTTFGGELGFKSKFRDDGDLDTGTDERQASADEGLKLEAFLELSENVVAFVELQGEVSQDYDVDSNSTENSLEWSRGQSWVYIDQPLDLPVGLQLGRQNVAETREWWWDTDLDAIRLYVRRNSFDLEIAVAEELGPKVLNDNFAEDKDIFRLLGKATLRLAPDTTLDLYYLRHNDHSSLLREGDTLVADREDEEGLSLTWVGARLYGDLATLDRLETEYWLDVARVEGAETLYKFADLDAENILVDSAVEQERAGWAFDVGATILFADVQMGMFSEPTITIGYAFGSGDDSSNGTFRQTGLQDNNGKFNGVNRFRYYGELARPELSNMVISTVSLGVRTGPDSSVELVHHNYQQVVPSSQHTLRIDADGNGVSRQLGNEIDLVVGIEEWKHWEIELIGSYFWPGSAFELSDPGWLLAGKLNFNF